MIESSISRFDNIIDNTGVMNGDGVYYIKCNWQYNSFTIYLTDLSNVWSSNITSKYIDNILKPQGMQLEEYMNLLKKSLLNQDKSKKQFDYKINKSKRSSNEIEFGIVIILSEIDGININSNIPLIKVNNSHQALQNYFNWLFDKYKSLTDQNQQLVQLNQTLQSQFNQSIEQNKIFIKEKDRIETDLYEKFIIILNEKKKKIREYKKKVDSLIIENNNIKKQQNINCKCNNSNNNNNKQSPQHPNTPVKNTPKKKIKFTNNSYGSIFDDVMMDEDNENNNNDNNNNNMTYKPTFNNSTPSLDLLSNDDIYNIPTTIRKRFKPPSANNNDNTTTSTTTTTTTTTFSSSHNNKNSNNIIKTPTKNRNPPSPNNNSPYKQQQQQQQQQQQFTLGYHPSPIKKQKNNNNNYITQPITPIKAKSKSRIFVFDDEDDDDDTTTHNNNINNINKQNIYNNNKTTISKNNNLNKSFNNDKNDDDLEPGASALLNEL